MSLPRRSARNNKVKPPRHLEDFDRNSEETPESESGMSSDEGNDKTVISNDQGDGASNTSEIVAALQAKLAEVNAQLEESENARKCLERSQTTKGAALVTEIVNISQPNSSQPSTSFHSTLPSYTSTQLSTAVDVASAASLAPTSQTTAVLTPAISATSYGNNFNGYVPISLPTPQPQFPMPFIQPVSNYANFNFSTAGIANPVPNSQVTNDPRRKLYDLPEFSGKPEEWPMFVTSFKESTAAYGYTNLENMFRLQKCLKGAARETVECLLIHPNNVQSVISQLEFMFGRSELLIRSQLSKVREIAVITDNKIEHLIPFATKVKNLSTFLEAYG